MKTVLRLTFLLFVSIGLTGCAHRTLLYQDKDHVTVYLVNAPEVTKDSYSIEFQFEAPTNDTHLIQTLNQKTWSATESFRVIYYADETSVDHHWVAGPIQTDWRRMVIRPGKVVGTDEANTGFSMLPGGWPDRFNWTYRYNAGKITDQKDPRFGTVVPDPQFGVRHKIQGFIEYERPEYATIYHIQFVNGLLTWSVEGTDIKYEWKAEKVVD